MVKYDTRTPEGAAKLISKCINLELKPYGTTVEKIRKLKQGAFYRKYSFKTVKAYFKWLKDCDYIIQTQVTPKPTASKRAEMLKLLDFAFGLNTTALYKKGKLKINDIPYHFPKRIPRAGRV